MIHYTIIYLYIYIYIPLNIKKYYTFNYNKLLKLYIIKIFYFYKFFKSIIKL